MPLFLLSCAKLNGMKEITGILAAPIFKLGLQRSLLELQLRETLQQKPNSATLRKTRIELKGNELT